ncbi:MAG: magnesium transporter, partial [Clostridia bacterium]|nr:magnesium transporter [Clostridia bacterium]
MELQGEEFALRLQGMLEKKQYRELRGAFSLFEAPDIAHLFGQFEEKEMLLLFRILPKDTAAEVFVEMEAEQKESLINSFSDAYLQEVLSELYIDDTVELIEEMPAGVVKRILRNADEESREAINRILRYPKDSAGSMMTTEYVRLYKDMTVAEAFERIRRDAYDKETVYTCYVTERNRLLIGVVTVRDLLMAEEDAVIGDIMTENVIFAETHDDRESVANAMSKYDFLALPVVDKGKRLVGIVTYDDASDVLQEEITEDIEKMAAIVPTDKPYLRTGTWETWKSRIPWLML